MPPKIPPKGWQELYQLVVKARKTQLPPAPVDTIGCDKLGKKDGPREEYRYQTLLALMLSAQTKDQKTAEAMKNLQDSGLVSVAKVDKTPVKRVNELIAMVGMHNKKAEYIKATSKMILEEHHGKVPSTVEKLCALPGVGPKMAHLFVQCADGKVQGIGVDTHVHRIAQRWKWVPQGDNRTPEHTRRSLEEWLPKEHWPTVNGILVGWGQIMCLPRFPKCGECPVNKLCPAAFKESATTRRVKRTSSKEAVADIEDLAKKLPTAAPGTRKTQRGGSSESAEPDAAGMSSRPGKKQRRGK